MARGDRKIVISRDAARKQVLAHADGSGSIAAMDPADSSPPPTPPDVPPPPPPPPPAPEAEPPPAPGTHSADEKQWAMFCHLAAFAGLVILGIGQILGPLVIWLIKKDTMPFVNQEGKESVNFQISVTIYGIVSCLAMLVCI